MAIVPLADGSVMPTKATVGRTLAAPDQRQGHDARPALINPAARIFQVLFWPPILLVLLGLGLATVVWILAVHGFGEGLHDAIYQPWLIVVLVPIIIASAFFHEFGHATALRYGGGKVRGMGAGIYLVYPVFYTDVTDNYRLGRWSRLRTDTGGFYFNLVFVAGDHGHLPADRAGFLLLAMLAILFSIVHQSLPIVRLDGYWVLADLTGILDPLGADRSVPRSVLPISGWKGRRLPPLADVGEGCSSSDYILLTAPLLA